MKIKQVFSNKKDFLDLLLLADEEEKMINKYINNSDMFLLFDNDLIGSIVIYKINNYTYEIKNLAIYKKYQNKGYGKFLIDTIFNNYYKSCKRIIVGTGDSPLTLPFYKKCGFKIYDKIENFFLNNYDNPIYENGILLKDMIYLEKNI